jgi:hypothetical protein
MLASGSFTAMLDFLNGSNVVMDLTARPQGRKHHDEIDPGRDKIMFKELFPHSA